MIIIPIAFDSFSTRSMATKIVTRDVKIFIDPSIAIAPKRYGLPPHEVELLELKNGEERIVQALSDVDLVFITHYHWDHAPHPSKTKLYEALIDKKIYAKSFTEKVNKSQEIRGKQVYMKLRGSSEFNFADGKELNFGNTYIKFSDPVWHGEKGTPLGYVLMVYIEEGSNSILFASDVQGPIVRETAEKIIEFNPKTLIISGPPTYLPRKIFTEKMLEKAKENMQFIIENSDIKEIVLDHHLLRDPQWDLKIKEIIKLSRDLGVSVKTAANYIGRSNLQMEAKRKDLWRKSNKEDFE